MKIFSIKYLLLFFLFLVLILNCKLKTEANLPLFLDTQHNFKIINKNIQKNINKLHINKKIKIILKSLEFRKASIANYEYKLMDIQLALLEFEDINNAFGFYSQLCLESGRKWNSNLKLLRFKRPYFCATKNNYAIYLYSPKHPGNYFNFFKEVSINLLKFLDLRKKENLEYHSKIFPIENKYRNSLFYVKQKIVNNFEIQNAYAAYYQFGHIRTAVYIQKFKNSKNAKKTVNQYIHFLKNKLIAVNNPVNLWAIAGKSYQWKQKQKNYFIFQYKWLVFYFDGVNNTNSINHFMRTAMKNMHNIRHEVLGKKK